MQGRPIIGIEGLLKLVTVVQKVKASLVANSEDLRLCHPKLSPPADKQSTSPVVAPTAAGQPEAITVASEPTTRKSVEVPSPGGTAS